MSTHTPGPWRTENRMVFAHAFDGSEKAIIDRVRGGTPLQADANARLIAAAPELLFALKAALAEITDDGSGAVLDVLELEGRAAIAKAEGT